MKTILLLVSLFFTLAAHAQITLNRTVDIRLAWDPLPAESGVQGYKIYWGLADTTEYSNMVDVPGGQTVTAWVKSIPTGERIKFAIAAYVGTLVGTISDDIFFTPSLLDKVTEFRILEVIMSFTPAPDQ